VSLGDWGAVNSDQAGVAKQIGIHAGTFNATFLLALGDNFYGDGVSSDTDPQWTTTYRNVYTDPNLNIPWYALLGNHDHHMKRGQGEIDYYVNKRDSRWYCPALWYNFIYPIPGTTKTVEFIYMDTVVSSGGDDSGVNKTQQQEQYLWINNTLKASQSDWILFAGHYPVYSAGEHGNTADLVSYLMPILEEYGVDTYFCGHDHTLQHLHDTVDGVQYLVSGNGAWRGTIKPIKQSVFGVVDPGFMTHRVTSDDTLITEAIDLNGKSVYNYTQRRRMKKWEMTKTVTKIV